MQSLEGFSKEVAKVWQTGVLGVNLGEIIAALVVIFVFLFARRLFYRFVTSSLKSITRKTKTDLDDLILEAIEKPLEFAFVVIGLVFRRGKYSPFRTSCLVFLTKLFVP